MDITLFCLVLLIGLAYSWRIVADLLLLAVAHASVEDTKR